MWILVFNVFFNLRFALHWWSRNVATGTFLFLWQEQLAEAHLEAIVTALDVTKSVRVLLHYLVSLLNLMMTLFIAFFS